ncbi:twin-arginine translocase subunit TatC [Leifsonia sp. H3M29-4]|uniref:twin-arginine translocase subunit TatC n=1 Tax=Salinibacterium metalliresistens TaxID=3031321 RepID=UPI0023DB4CBF|nr:twin-arginine translocase subunit TatC [Salinibacterium metalliresistens]MDF1477975.1 twin-arginine translocase subunit TatC [Salinibacterium metalliresistens]
MSIGAHLAELRRRVFIAAIAVLIGTVVGWFLADAVLALLIQPITQSGDEGGRQAALNFDTVTSAFDLRLRLSLQIGLILAAPVWLFQAFAFVVPGLTRAERKGTFAFVGAAVPLFAGGCVAGAVVLPHIVVLMTGFAPEASATLLSAGIYYDFALKLVLAVGIAFVLPLFLVVLNWMGVLSGRTILAGWRYAIVAICIFTALATPAADVLSMFLLAIPMLALYFGAAGTALLHDRSVRRSEARREVAADSTTVAGRVPREKKGTQA